MKRKQAGHPKSSSNWVQWIFKRKGGGFLLGKHQDITETGAYDMKARLGLGKWLARDCSRERYTHGVFPHIWTKALRPESVYNQRFCSTKG